MRIPKKYIFVFRIIDTVCLICISLFVIFGILEEIVGYRNMVDLLENLVPFNYNGFFVTTLICTAILVLSKYIQKAKMNDK